MSKRMTSVVVVVILFVVISIGFIIYRTVDREYYYSGVSPPQPHTIAMAVGSDDTIYLVWNIPQIESSGHNMQGVWIGRIDKASKNVINRGRISHHPTGLYPLIAIDSSGTIYITWFSRSENGVVLDSTGYEIRKLHLPNLTYSGIPPVLNIDQFGNLHLRYMEEFPINKTLIFNGEGNVLDTMDPNSIEYLTTYQLNKNLTSRPYEGSVEVTGEHPVYVLDSDNKTWIASVGSEAYLTVLDINGDKLVENKELDIVPNCVSSNLRLLIVGMSITISIVIIIIWIWWLRKTKKT